MNDRVHAVFPDSAVRPRSETTSHCVASVSPLSSSLSALASRWSPFQGCGGDDIDAGLELADRVQNRKVGDDVLVELGGDIHRAAPDFDAVLFGDFRRAGAADVFQEVVALNSRQQIAVADAIDIDRDLRRVDRDKRRALLALTRQNVILAGEMNLRRPIAHINFVVGVLQQGFADGRGQALSNDDGIALAMLQPLDANLLIFRADRAVGRAGDGDIGREIRLARQRLGELEANPRRGGIIVDLVVGDAKSIFFAQILVGLADVEVVAPVETGAIGVERGTPHFAPRKQIAQ